MISSERGQNHLRYVGVALLVSACTLLTSSVCNADAGQNDGRLNLTLQQAISMVLKNNLDIQLEQLDQRVADFSLERTQGGGTPRTVNYNVAEAPLGPGIAAVPLFSSLSTILTPTSVDPTGVNVFSSYDKSHVTETQRSLSVGTTPFSA